MNEEKVAKEEGCNEIDTDQEEVEKHVLSHTESQNLSSKIQCDQCIFSTTEVATFIRHIRTMHVLEKCQYCSFVGSTKDDVQTHTKDNHEDIVVLLTMAQEVHGIYQMFENFETFKEELGDVVKCIGGAVNNIENTQNEIKQEQNVIKQTQNEMKQELFLIRNNQAQLSSSSNNSSGKSKASSDGSVAPSINLSRSYASVTKTTCTSSAQVPPQQSSNDQPRIQKTLFIGDSISSNVDIKSLEDATGSSITSVRAYCSLNDTTENEVKQAAKFPNKNFQDVTPAELAKDVYNTLILQAGSEDITNLNTRANQSQYMEYFKQEAVISAKNLFQTATNALSGSSTLEKVVIMKQTPRYDPLTLDPLSLKPALSELYNNTLTQEWMDSDYKHKIHIGNHNNDCNGAIREARYRETRTGKYDGIHLYGSSGRKAYTKSVLNILKDARVTTEEYDYHQTCPQYRYQHRQDRHTNYRTHNTVQQFTLPVYNRFSKLARADQGN